MRKRPLSSLAEVIVSYQFRGRLPLDPSGGVWVAQGKDVDEHHRLQMDSLERISEPEAGFFDRYLLRQFDVLVMNRGQHAYATCVLETPPPRLIAAATFHCIRLPEASRTRLAAEFLTWLLNEPSTQSALARSATGTIIQALSATQLRELRLVVPPPERQRCILELSQAIETELRLHTELTRLRRAQLSALVASD